ncbi:MAG TPA: hypothetical protein VNU68_03675 [Verrucomicrobiae bacterium]|nr:hypothetical protein [Verrucomicrobiae bacterium]
MKPFVISALVVGIGSCSAWLLLTRARAPSEGRLASTPAASSSITAGKSSSPVLANTAPDDGAQAAEGPVQLAPVAARPAAPPAAVSLPEPTPQSRQLLGSLCRLDQPSVPRSPEQVADWKQHFQQLVAQGPSAVSAIHEFLAKNVDLDFGPGNGLGYASARAAMFDALVQIGGAEGLTGTLQTLQDTADPREIALLAQNLEKLAPGEHRQEAIAAARDALAMAASGKLEGDVAPLFEVLNKFGDTSVVTDLMQTAKQWNYYSAMALSQLPDGAGIPTLIEVAQGTSGGKLNALEMLAQMSMQYPEARAALLEQALANKISANMWPYLTPLLAGDLYHYQDSAFDVPMALQGKPVPKSAHVVFGNQHFYTAPPADVLTPDEINHRLALIKELESMASDRAALEALAQASEMLNSRHPQFLAVSP